MNETDKTLTVTLTRDYVEFPPNTGNMTETPCHVQHDDGSFTLHIPARYIRHLAHQLAKWERHSETFVPEYTPRWRSNPKKRDDHRYAVDCENALETMHSLLGVNFVKALLAQAKEIGGTA